MPENILKKAYLDHYADLRNRLKMRLGSYNEADDILHDTWIQLHQAKSPPKAAKPLAYLHRMARNISVSQYRRQDFFVVDTEALLHIADDTLGPEDQATISDDIKRLNKLLDCLTPRRKEILLLSRVYEVPTRELAKRFGISTRMVEKELKSALQYCSEHLDRKLIQRFGPVSRKGADA